MALQAIEVGQDAAAQIDVDDVVAPGVVEGTVIAVRDLPYVLRAPDDAFAVEEARRQLEVVSGRPHRDGHRPLLRFLAAAVEDGQGRAAAGQPRRA